MAEGGGNANGISITITVDSKEVDTAKDSVDKLTASLQELQKIANSGIFKTIETEAKSASDVLNIAAEGLQSKLGPALKKTAKDMEDVKKSSGKVTINVDDTKVKEKLTKIGGDSSKVAGEVSGDLTGVARKLEDLSNIGFKKQLDTLDQYASFWNSFKKSMNVDPKSMLQFRDTLNQLVKGDLTGDIGGQFIKVGKEIGLTRAETAGLLKDFLVLDTVMAKASGKPVAQNVTSYAQKIIRSKMEFPEGTSVEDEKKAAEKRFNNMVDMANRAQVKFASQKGFEVAPKYENTSPVIDDLNKLAQAERNVSIESLAMKNAIKLNDAGLKELSTKTGMSKDSLQSYSRGVQELDALAAKEEMVADATYAMNNAHRLSPELLSNLSAYTGVAEQDLLNYSRASEQAAASQQVLQVYMRQSRAAIGPVGAAFRDVTMQLYWASLGFLFLTMTMGRADKAEYTKLQNANSLAKSYYNLSKMQRDLNKTTIEYGAGSEQARDASAQLLMAQNDLILQNKQLEISIKGEVLAGLQSTFSMLPLIVNTIYSVVTAFGTFSGIVAAGRQVQMNAITTDLLQVNSKSQLALAIGALSTAEGTHNALKVTSVVITGGVIVATVAETKANMGVLSSLWALITAKATLLTLGTMLVGGAVALVAITAVQAYTTAKAAEETKKLKAEQEALTNAYENAGGAMANFGIIFDNGVTPSLRAAREEIVKLTSELNILKGIESGIGDIGFSSTVKTTGLNSAVIGNSGTSNINISFGDVSVRSDQDIKAIAEVSVIEVEKAAIRSGWK